MMHDSRNQNNEPIRKIIDPKSGFSLYLKNFKDSSIYHISTEVSFPHQSSQENDSFNEFSQSNIDIKKELDLLKKNHDQLSKQSSETISTVTKSNHQLTYIIYGMIGLFILSILF